jgi:hypothetical protein
MTRVSNLLGSLAVASTTVAGGLFVVQSAPASAATFSSGSIFVDALLNSPATPIQSFTVSGNFDQAGDTVTITGNNFATLDREGYNVNAAGVLVTPNTSGPIGGTFIAPGGATLPGGNFGALLLGNGTLGYKQVFPANTANGLNSSSPSQALTTTVNVSSLFPSGITSGTVLQFLVNDTVFGDNSNGFTASATFTNSVVVPPTSTSVPEPFTVIGTLVGGSIAIRMRRKLKLAAK